MTPESESPRNEQVYRFGPARIAVTADDRDAARWLREFLTPWFEPLAPGATDLAVGFSVSSDRHAELEERQAVAACAPCVGFVLDSHALELPAWRQGRVLWVADAERGCFYALERGRVTIVARRGFPRARVALMRVVRELATLRMRAEPGVLDLHAAAFAQDGRAILIVGPKRAGKTTLLLGALRSGRASLLANDRVIVESGRAHGVPTLVSIRPDTLERFPELQQRLPFGAALRLAEERAPAACDDDRPDKRALTPGQLASGLGVGSLPCAAIAAIVFPEICAAQARFSLSRLAPQDGAGRLRASLYGARAGELAPSAFEAVTGAGPAASRAPDGLVARLAARTPMFALRLGPDAERDGADAWLRALPREPLRERVA